MLKRNQEGFSLVEMLIAVAITSILMLSLIAIMGYCTNNMNRTQQKIDLQDQAKDAFNHISSYSMEASNVEWDDTKNVLVVTKKVVDNSTLEKTETNEDYYYWCKNNKMFFASKLALATEAGAEADLDSFVPSFTENNNHLMAENVSNFNCEITAPDPTADKNDHIVNVILTMSKGDLSFDCNREVCWRNQ